MSGCMGGDANDCSLWSMGTLLTDLSCWMLEQHFLYFTSKTGLVAPSANEG